MVLDCCWRSARDIFSRNPAWCRYRRHVHRCGARSRRPPLVPRRLRLPIRERIDAQGDVLVPLDDASVNRALDTLAEQNIEAVAVGFLHSFTNPDHERRVGEAVARRFPDIPVSLSSDVSPEMREYERFSTACANAYLQPLIGSYLRNLAGELERSGFRCPM